MTAPNLNRRNEAVAQRNSGSLSIGTSTFLAGSSEMEGKDEVQKYRKEGSSEINRGKEKIKKWRRERRREKRQKRKK